MGMHMEQNTTGYCYSLGHLCAFLAKVLAQRKANLDSSELSAK